MFSIQQQKKTDEGLYETVNVWKFQKFSEDLVARATKYANETNTFVSFYLTKDTKIPTGYSWKELQYSIKIWKEKYSSMEDLPF